MGYGERLHVAAQIYAANADVRASTSSKDKLNKGLALSALQAAKIFLEAAEEMIQVEEIAREKKRPAIERSWDAAAQGEKAKTAVGGGVDKLPSPLPIDPAQSPSSPQSPSAAELAMPSGIDTKDLPINAKVEPVDVETIPQQSDATKSEARAKRPR